MPLDQDGRSYADALYQERVEHIQKEYREKLVDVRNDFIRRNLMQSGMYGQAYAQVLVWHVDQMGEARADSLLQAYERSGLPFDDAAFREISSEVAQFCWGQQHHAVHAIHEMLGQMPLLKNVALMDSLTKQIERGVGGVIDRINRRLLIKRKGTVLDEKRAKVIVAETGHKWDAFISHASEDKDDFVRPLHQALEKSGVLTWFDEALKVGDSLRAKIDEGLSRSRFGIIVLSQNFFAKGWPQAELDGLMAREIGGTKVILPVWYKISYEEVKAKSPLLAGRLAARSEEGLEVIISKLRDAMGLS